MKQPHVLDNNNIGKLLFKLALPATVGMLVMTLYNIVDTIFVGKGIGTEAIAALSIAFPVMALIMATAQMIGIGGASLLSRSLGEHEPDKASKTLGNVLSLALFNGLIFSVAGFLFLEPLLALFGAADTVLPYTRDYLRIILMAAMLPGVAMSLNNIARAEGKAQVAMFTMIIGAVINIILDAIFILGLKWGIKGAAYATVAGYIASTSFLLFYFLSGRSSVALHFRNLKPDPAIIKEILGIGVASFVRQGAMSILVVILNRTLAQYGGAVAIAVFGIIFRLLHFVFTPLMGIAQGMQPVAGYNYGAKRYHQLKETVRIAAGAATIVSTLGALFLMIFATPLLRLFSNDAQLLEYGRSAMRYIMLAFPVVGFQVVGATLFQALGRAVPNFILSLSRQFLFLIPMVAILPKFLQLTGVWIAFPIADTLSAILTALLLIPLIKEYRRHEIADMEKVA